MWHVRSARGLGLASALCAVSAACFIDNPNAAPATTSTGPGGSGAGDSGAPDGGTGGAAPSICDENGGYYAVQKVALDLLGTVAADCRISPFFTVLTPAQHQHFGDCLTKQLAVITKCPGIRYDVDSDGADCRDMKSSHHGLGIRGADFDAFVEDTIATLHANHVKQEDIDAMSPALLFLKSDIVTNSAPGLDKDTCDAGDGGP